MDTLFAASLVRLVLYETLSAIQHRAATLPHFHESASRAGHDPSLHRPMHHVTNRQSQIQGGAAVTSSVTTA